MSTLFTPEGRDLVQTRQTSRPRFLQFNATFAPCAPGSGPQARLRGPKLEGASRRLEERAPGSLHFSIGEPLGSCAVATIGTTVAWAQRGTCGAGPEPSN